MRLFCFGFGYSAESLARRLSPRDIVVAGTRTSLAEAPEPGVELAAYKWRCAFGRGAPAARRQPRIFWSASRPTSKAT